MAGDGTPSQLEKKQKELRESLISIAPIFGEKPYFMSDEFTIVDCVVTPILWRLPAMGIELPKIKQPSRYWRIEIVCSSVSRLWPACLNKKRNGLILRSFFGLTGDLPWQ